MATCRKGRFAHCLKSMCGEGLTDDPKAKGMQLNFCRSCQHIPINCCLLFFVIETKLEEAKGSSAAGWFFKARRMKYPKESLRSSSHSGWLKCGQVEFATLGVFTGYHRHRHPERERTALLLRNQPPAGPCIVHCKDGICCGQCWVRAGIDANWLVCARDLSLQRCYQLGSVAKNQPWFLTPRDNDCKCRLLSESDAVHLYGTAASAPSHGLKEHLLVKRDQATLANDFFSTSSSCRPKRELVAADSDSVAASLPMPTYRPSAFGESSLSSTRATAATGTSATALQIGAASRNDLEGLLADLIASPDNSEKAPATDRHFEPSMAVDHNSTSTSAPPFGSISAADGSPRLASPARSTSAGEQFMQSVLASPASR
jgi:hypothetical protein